jgi:hypothetical protein
VAFVYIPTVVGHNQAWTANIATHCMGRPIAIPAIERFFSVTEERLSEYIVHLCDRQVPVGITRDMIFNASGSLAEAVAIDRGGEDIHEVRLPRLVWWIVSLSRFHLVNRVLQRSISTINKALRAKAALLPVTPFYYAIFRAQCRFADLLVKGPIKATEQSKAGSNRAA